MGRSTETKGFQKERERVMESDYLRVPWESIKDDRKRNEEGKEKWDSIRDILKMERKERRTKVIHKYGRRVKEQRTSENGGQKLERGNWEQE